MTQKGRKYNHSIKLLRGYGVSIGLKNNRVCLRGGTDIFTGEAEKEEWFVNQIPYERIMISGKGYVSTEAIKLLTEKNVHVILTDTFGNLVTTMHPITSTLAGTNYRIGQYDTFRDPTKADYLQKQFLIAKLDSQIRFLSSLDMPELKDAIAALGEHRKTISKARDKRDLLQIESVSSLLYFGNYVRLFDSKYGFTSRHSSGFRNSNRYASDVVNGLLNYGYTVLASEIAKFVNGLGLDPYFGVFHTAHTSFHALVYDLIESFRWLVESTVYQLAIVEPYQGRIIKKSEYAWTREGKIVMDNSLIQRFLQMLERKLKNERLYRYKSGIKRRDGLSMCQELTIAKIAVSNLADFCIGKRSTFAI